MPRNRINRNINFKPRAKFYKPQGIPMNRLEEVGLAADELEAIRLRYVEGLDQTEAAEKMQISQSTFQRILASANQTVGEALVTGKAIRIED